MKTQSSCFLVPNKIATGFKEWVYLPSKLLHSKTNTIGYYLYVKFIDIIQMDLFTEQKQTHREHRSMVIRGDGQGVS